ncbi:helix-turn-helix transcriptional regulator [Candidatus Bathyarchaeota archaeon]|nr:helix-turn-helix transcriptional regulator [Candidatus Bathyarchaeota archaeon]
MSKESKCQKDGRTHLCLCPLEGVIDVISKKWTLLIINVLGNCEKLRFNGLMEQLEGVSPKTLSDTLKALQKENLIMKETFNEIPPRVEYSLTADGKELRKAIVPLLKWAAERDCLPKQKCVQNYRNKPSHRIEL